MKTESMNGTHKHAEPDKKALPVKAMRVYRVEEGDSVIVRMLSEKICGCFTHFYRGNSHYCRGVDCNPIIHKADRTWKGYVAALLFLPDLKAWRPVPLEITECLELDFRGIYQRGQEWELFRELPIDKKRSPVMGKLLKELDPGSLPPAFDFVSCLQNMYRVMDLDLRFKNPLPNRVMMNDIEGDVPEAMQPKVDERVGDTRSAVEEMKEIMKKRQSLGDRKRG